ncbi:MULTISPECIES: hypothetical protein [unclassified Mesorhizobium]|uniref:hypothetical protein n=1 Tax=unclassified Mesorhizobium TaxID=325217 RepID=UPI003334D61F
MASWPVKCRVGIFWHLELKPDLQKLEPLGVGDRAIKMEAHDRPMKRHLDELPRKITFAGLTVGYSSPAKAGTKSFGER